jgi:hypothetical protein
MDDSKPDAAPRDVFVELDEIIATMKTVLKAVANMGEEIIKYRESWDKTASQIAILFPMLEDRIVGQAQLNEGIAETMKEHFTVTTALIERVATIEETLVTPITNVIENFEGRLSALESGYRLILPG